MFTKKYTLEQWEKDMEHMQKYPNDLQFINSIAEKVKTAPKGLRRQIIETIESEYMLERDTLGLLRRVAARHPKCFVVYKNHANPWFEG